jgi:hypothetical protein
MPKIVIGQKINLLVTEIRSFGPALIERFTIVRIATPESTAGNTLMSTIQH